MTGGEDTTLSIACFGSIGSHNKVFNLLSMILFVISGLPLIDGLDFTVEDGVDFDVFGFFS